MEARNSLRVLLQLCRTIGTEKNGQAFKSIGVLVTSREALARVPTKRIAVFDHEPVLNQIDGKAVHLVDQRWKCQLVGLELDFTLSKCRQPHRYCSDACL